MSSRKIKPKRPTTFYKQVPTLTGAKKYEFVSLTRREAMQVAHASLITVLGAVGNVAGLMFRDMTKEDSETRGKMLQGIIEGLANIKFETVWGLAESLLRDVTIDDGIVIEDINESDYFVENIDEFYVALAYAVEGNYPKLFLKLREAFGDFDLPDTIKNLGTSNETFEKYDTHSKDTNSKTSKSPGTTS